MKRREFLKTVLAGLGCGLAIAVLPDIPEEPAELPEVVFSDLAEDPMQWIVDAAEHPDPISIQF